MTNDFLLATEYASQSISLMQNAAILASKGEFDRAKHGLERCMVLMREAEPTLRKQQQEVRGQVRAELHSRFSDGSLKRHHSAHEAICWLWFQIYRVLANSEWTVPKDLGAWLGMDLTILEHQLERERSVLSGEGDTNMPISVIQLWDPAAEGEARKPKIRQSEVKTILGFKYDEDVKRLIRSGELKAIKEGRSVFVLYDSLLGYAKRKGLAIV